MKKVLLLLCMFASTQVFAEVAPLYRSTKEIKAILSDKRVIKALGTSAMVSSLVRDGNTYVVTAGKCSVEVQVTYVTPPVPGFAGPAKLELHVGDVNCIPEE